MLHTVKNSAERSRKCVSFETAVSNSDAQNELAAQIYQKVTSFGSESIINRVPYTVRNF
jgi:hypothetical protein